MYAQTLLKSLAVAVACVLPLTVDAARPIAAEDWYRFQALSDVQIAPDGGSVAYLVTRYDRDADESRSALWSVSWAGGDNIELTHGEGVSAPRFSPDGRYLGFLAARPADGPTQLWILDRRGGEAREASHVTGEIEDYDWSPDGKQVVLVMRPAAEPAADAARKASTNPRPIVVDGYQFKQDKQGYRLAGSRTHLFLLDVTSGTLSQLTHESDRDDSAPTFAPDGATIAYVSNPLPTPGAAGRDDIFVIGASAGSTPRHLVSTASPNKQSLQFSPDGTRLAYLEGDILKFNAYFADRLAIVDVGTGKARTLTGALDRAVTSPQFSADGRSILLTVEDDRYRYPTRLDLASGTTERLAGPVVVHDLVAAKGRVAVLSSSDTTPGEIFALENGKLRALSHHNAALMAELKLGAVEDVAFKSRDGTDVHGLLYKPVGYVAGQRYPTILWIHGGPNDQDDHSLELWGYGPALERQTFASHGYAVLAINYRGGSGRGAAYARAIAGDWGHKEVEDLLAGVDYAVAQGIADPKRLGIGGWSYGGILTDYTIATDPRFAAAISGAGSANQTAMYGVDQYVVQYNAELGAPWKTPALWMKVSYPFFHADKIRTPTLFMGGDKDFNVPVAGGEQMYQALRTLGVPAELVVYPGEFHVLTRPSFLVDRTQRFLAWMNRYLGETR